MSVPIRPALLTIFLKILPSVDLNRALQEEADLYHPLRTPGETDANTDIARNDDEGSLRTIDKKLEDLSLRHSEKVFGKSRRVDFFFKFYAALS